MHPEVLLVTLIFSSALTGVNLVLLPRREFNAATQAQLLASRAALSIARGETFLANSAQRQLIIPARQWTDAPPEATDVSAQRSGTIWIGKTQGVIYTITACVSFQCNSKSIVTVSTKNKSENPVTEINTRKNTEQNTLPESVEAR